MSKRLMPTYLVNFLKEIYDGTITSNFGERMVSRQFIASVKTLYETLGGDNPSDYSRRMVNEYLIKFFNEIEIVEYTDDDVLMTKTISSDLVYPACRVDAIGGMSYVVDGIIQDSAVTAIKTYNIGDELLDTYTVPSAITSLEGYGQGINSTVYNNVDFASGKYIKKVGVVDLGTLNWALSGTGDNARFITLSISSSILKGTINLLSNEYSTTTWDNLVNTNNDMIIASRTSDGYLGVRNLSYADVTTFKTAMEGVYLYYELATPVETTITEQAPLLECVDSGSIVFENTYNQDMPNEVTTWIKES